MHQPITILQINTALQKANVSISRDGKVMAERINTNQYEHASFVQPAILELCEETGCTINDFHAVSVINGPGSYTGLRVGLASAKGICYVKQIPLICINTLEWMANGLHIGTGELICPMIDARRDEVFTALYNHQHKLLLSPQAMILDQSSFSDWLEKSVVHFVGDGAEKWKNIVQHPHAKFPLLDVDASEQASMSHTFYTSGRFSDLAYVEPFYTKDFFSTQRK